MIAGLVALAGCRDVADPRAVGLPRTAPGVVLLAQIAPDLITVDGALVGVDQWVDLDRGDDSRYGFRVQVEDADGNVLLSRSTIGPALVESFLQYWSDVAGVDILAGIPSLGRFPLVVPVLDEADHIELQALDADGEYVTRGTWSYDALDDAWVEPTVVPEGREELHGSSMSPWDTLDVVILPDGYTESQLGLFARNADDVAEKLLELEPFRSYADRVTVTRLDVPSNASGASYECETCGLVDNTFGSIFPIELINRVTGGDYPNRPMFQSEQWKVAEALAGVPWDVVVVLVNSDAHAGMAVHYASVTRGVGDIGPTAVHEIGHAFGMLGDEYVSDACVRSDSQPLPENITDKPNHPPWEAFVDPQTPLPTPPGEGYGVGTFAGAWNCPDLYRAEEACRMNEGHGPFCAACTELLLRRLMRFGDPASTVEVVGGRVVVAGELPDTTVLVRADGAVIGQGDAATAEIVVPDDAKAIEIEVEWHPDGVIDDPTRDLVETWSFAR